MDYFAKQELELLKGETEQSEELKLASQILYANKLQNGLGEEIVEYLKNPPKVDKKAMRKYKRKKKWEDIIFRIHTIINKNGSSD